MTDSNELLGTDGAKQIDPYLIPAFSFADRARRVVWGFCHAVLYRTSPRPLHSWRSFLLRLFGGKMGPNCHFYPRGKVWAPWNLTCEASACLGDDDAEIYNPALVHMGSHSIISQQAYICSATHDYNHPAFPLISFPSR